MLGCDADRAGTSWILEPGLCRKASASVACQYMFHRLGRAMIRPIFAQISNRKSRVSMELRFALQWWCKVMELDIVEERFWKYPEAPVAHLFVAAAGKDSRLMQLQVRLVFVC